MRKLNLINQRFGRLAVKSAAPNVGIYSRWNCICDCGKAAIVRTHELRSGDTQSCGCLHVESIKKHGHCVDDSTTKEYGAWVYMNARCVANPESQYFRNYAGRGITVCEKWAGSFSAFLNDMGPRPAGTSLDRINNDGNYEPGNCRWTTQAQQTRNRRGNVVAEYKGQPMILTDIAASAGVSVQRLRTWYWVKGFPLDVALQRSTGKAFRGKYRKRAAA